MVTIYHGSKAKIKGLKNPEEFRIGKRKDFGYGFYCTRDLEQADRWANRRGTSENNSLVLQVPNHTIVHGGPCLTIT